MDSAVRSIALNHFSHNAQRLAGIDFRAVADEVEEPEMGHFAVYHLHVLLRHRNPFRLSRRTGGGCIHHWFAREEHIGFAVFVPLDIGTKILVFVDRDIGLPELEEFFIGLCLENLFEVVLLAIGCILGVSDYVSESCACRLLRVATCFVQFGELNATCTGKQKIRHHHIF